MTENATPSTTNTPTPDEIGEELKRLALEWPIILNERDADFASPRGQVIRATIAPEFSAILDGYPGKMSWAELLQVWGQEHVEYPNCHLETTSCQAYVDVKKGTAKIFMELDMKFVERIGLKALTELRICLEWRWNYSEMTATEIMERSAMSYAKSTGDQYSTQPIT
ncbi:hypothetical protein PRZ48_012409 [Zasmidium cellare]|uniref:Uncharacterized protein n=1 Tax=Zasmidium cellare TaxID=395010 RepID=A0ABR0E4T0_ZASCE|nr:hypothetical protein PRZ48_012409 [Zasmidium cellare]